MTAWTAEALSVAGSTSATAQISTLAQVENTRLSGGDNDYHIVLSDPSDGNIDTVLNLVRNRLKDAQVSLSADESSGSSKSSNHSEDSSNSGGEVCCLALTPSCLACAAGMTVDEFCKANPNKYGCPGLPECRCATNDISFDGGE